jgi:CcmD family protein
MFIQEAPADTFGYMFFGYAVILVTMALYIVSLKVRLNNLEKDLELLEELED